MRLQRSAGNQAVCSMLDVLSADGEDATGSEYLDATRELARNGGGTPAPPAAASSGGSGGGAAAPAATAVPVNLQQIVTSWAPGTTKYGFQVKFRVSSSSG